MAGPLATCGIWSANIPSRTGIISERTFAAAVSARVGRLSPFVAVHVRRTDLPGYHGRRQVVHD